MDAEKREALAELVAQYKEEGAQMNKYLYERMLRYQKEFDEFSRENAKESAALPVEVAFPNNFEKKEEEIKQQTEIKEDDEITTLSLNIGMLVTLFSKFSLEEIENQFSLPVELSEFILNGDALLDLYTIDHADFIKLLLALKESKVLTFNPQKIKENGNIS